MIADADLSRLQKGAGHQAAPVALAVARLGAGALPGAELRRAPVPAPVRLGIALGISALVAGGGGVMAPAGVALVAALAREASPWAWPWGWWRRSPSRPPGPGATSSTWSAAPPSPRPWCPTVGTSASPLGELLYLGLLVAVTAAGGNRLLLGALAGSFRVLPPGAPWTGGRRRGPRRVPGRHHRRPRGLRRGPGGAGGHRRGRHRPRPGGSSGASPPSSPSSSWACR